jgi:hypothetical protein
MTVSFIGGGNQRKPVLHMRYKFHPMNPNKKHTFSKPILFID